MNHEDTCTCGDCLGLDKKPREAIALLAITAATIAAAGLFYLGICIHLDTSIT